MNILCVKWGDKYSAEYVNKLYSMVKRNLPRDFDFYCYTEDPSEIREEVKVIPIESDLERWWLKIDLLGKFNDHGTNILFDLDIVIINPLSKLMKHDASKLSVLYTAWKDGMYQPCSDDRYPTMYNSSIMMWKDDQGVPAYELFQRKKVDSLFKYKGVDRFLYNEQLELETLPIDIAYSYNKGTHYKTDSQIGLHRPAYEVCLFNEGADICLAQPWVKNYWT
jgi:hypothetical protein